MLALVLQRGFIKYHCSHGAEHPEACAFSSYIKKVPFFLKKALQYLAKACIISYVACVCAAFAVQKRSLRGRLPAAIRVISAKAQNRATGEAAPVCSF